MVCKLCNINFLFIQLLYKISTTWLCCLFIYYCNNFSDQHKVLLVFSSDWSLINNSFLSCDESLLLSLSSKSITTVQTRTPNESLNNFLQWIWNSVKITLQFNLLCSEWISIFWTNQLNQLFNDPLILTVPWISKSVLQMNWLRERIIDSDTCSHLLA